MRPAYFHIRPVVGETLFTMRPARHVHQREVLHVGSLTDADRVDVAAQDDVHPDPALGTHVDVANHLRADIDESCGIDGRENGIERPDHEKIIAAAA